MKMYDYLIAYQFTSKESFIGMAYGTVQVSRTNKIKTFADIDKLNKELQDLNPGSENMSIYNIMFLGKNEH